MYKEGIKYKLIGYQPIGVSWEPRVSIAHWKYGHWCPWGSSKEIKNFVITEVIDLTSEIRDDKINQILEK
jgi:hypothetical protein